MPLPMVYVGWYGRLPDDLPSRIDWPTIPAQSITGSGAIRCANVMFVVWQGLHRLGRSDLPRTILMLANVSDVPYGQHGLSKDGAYAAVVTVSTKCTVSPGPYIRGSAHWWGPKLILEVIGIGW
jgi:hypothetical protein